MKARIKWIQNRTFVGEFCSGHSMVMDDYPATGGRNIRFCPMEFFLGLGGCAAFNVVDLLQKSR